MEEYVQYSKVKAINTMAIKVNPISENKCELLAFNYVDVSRMLGENIYYLLEEILVQEGMLIGFKNEETELVNT